MRFVLNSKRHPPFGWLQQIEVSKFQFDLFKVKLMTLSLLSLPSYVCASNLYNTAFLSDDIANIADLSRFDDAKQPAGSYYVDLYVNDQLITSRAIRFVESQDKNDQSGLSPCFDLAGLKQMNINIEQIPLEKQNSCMLLDDLIDNAISQYDFHRQRLNISIPQAFLANQIRGYIPPSEWDYGIPAAMLNYNFSGVRGGKNDGQFLSLNSGINLGKWRLRNNSNWVNYQINNKNHDQWSNINTYAQRIIVPLKSELTLGESSSNNDIFDSVGFRGIRLNSAESMYPDSLQGFAPTVRATANSRAKVSIQQNGYTIYQNTVSPGPFEISDLSPTQNSGDLTVIVEEENGEKRSFLVPYSTIPLLQREGRYKYELIAGELRSGNSLKSTPNFVQGSLIQGLAQGYTVYGGTQLTDKYQAYTFGFGKNLGKYGAISLDGTHASTELADQSQYKGQSYRFLYAKSLNQLGTTFQLLGYRYSTRGFYTLDESSYKVIEGYDKALDINQDNLNSYNKDSNFSGTYHNLDYRKKGNFQLNISQNLDKYGSLYVSANVQNYWNTDLESRNIQAGYSNAWGNLFYTLSWAQTESILGNNRSQKDQTIALNLSIPLSQLFRNSKRKNTFVDQAYLSASAYQNQNGDLSLQSNLSGTLSKQRNLSYNISQNYNEANHYTGSVSLQYQAPFAQIGVGYSNSSNANLINYQISGGALIHEDGITLSQPLANTNVLIDAEKAKGVKVQNQTGIATNSRGFAVVPYASSYRINRIALDANSLNDHTEIVNNVQNVVPTEGAVVRANFSTQIGYRALIKLSHRGQDVPFASSIEEQNSQTNSMVGENGQAFLAGLPEQGRVIVKWGNADTDQCAADYSVNQSNISQHNALVSMELDCE